MTKTGSGLSDVLGQFKDRLRDVGGNERPDEQFEETEAERNPFETGYGAAETEDGAAERREATVAPDEEIERLRRSGRDTDAEIVGLVTENGGRIPQQAIVERVALSESTVSRRLTDLERAGLIERVTVGRENLVYLAGLVPDRFTT